MQFSQQAMTTWLDEGWGDLRMPRRTQPPRPYTRPLRLKLREIKCSKRIGVTPPRALIVRMKTHRIITAWNRANTAGFGPWRAPGSPYESYQARLVAGAILTDAQLKWISEHHAAKPKLTTWHALDGWAKPYITWRELKTLWAFGTTRSKRHTYLRRLSHLTAYTLEFARSSESREMASEAFWDMVVIMQVMPKERRDFDYCTYWSIINGDYSAIDPITLLGALSA